MFYIKEKKKYNNKLEIKGKRFSRLGTISTNFGGVWFDKPRETIEVRIP